MNSSYIIDYQGFKLGHNHLTLEFGSDLFDACADDDVISGSGVVDIDMERSERMMELDVTIDGKLLLPCDRCADDYEQLVAYKGKVVVKISDKAQELSDEQDGDIMWIAPNEPLDMKKWLYESVILSLPIMRVHPNREDCNADALKYLKSDL